MPTAIDLLSSETCDDVLTVDLDSRRIIIPPNVTNIGVESDDNVRKLHFRMPRYYCDIDLSTFNIRINYMNAENEGDIYEVDTSTIEDEVIHFDWVVGRNAVALKGNVVFIVCLRELNSEAVVEREFNTTVATLPVLPGLETDQAIIEQYHDLIAQWEAKLFGIGNTEEQKIRDAGAETISQIGVSLEKYIEDHSEELKGVSILSIQRTSGTGAPGTFDTYTITKSDGTADTFTVYNGADGEGSGDMLRNIYDPQDKNTDIFAYVDDRVQEVESLLDEVNGESLPNAEDATFGE